MGKLGPTGFFPKGRMCSGDEGELNIGITGKDGRVVMLFTTRVSWIGMYPEDAEKLADLLRQKADEARNS